MSLFWKPDSIKARREQDKDTVIRELRDANEKLEVQVSDLQLALCEVYELILGE